MNVNEVLRGKNKCRKRVGRGPGSGTGKTSGRGENGQKSRSGSSMHPLFEGGQMPLYRRIPKRGFTNGPFKTTYTAVNLYRLADFKDGDVVSEATLKQRGLISGKHCMVKILGKGEIEAKLKVQVAAISKSAAEKILAKGGEIVGQESS